MSSIFELNCTSVKSFPVKCNTKLHLQYLSLYICCMCGWFCGFPSFFVTGEGMSCSMYSPPAGVTLLILGVEVNIPKLSYWSVLQTRQAAVFVNPDLSRRTNRRGSLFKYQVMSEQGSDLFGCGSTPLRHCFLFQTQMLSSSLQLHRI